MRRGFLTTISCFGLFLLAGGLASKPLDRELRQGGWHSEYAPAREEARRTGKPLFVVFRCQP